MVSKQDIASALNAGVGGIGDSVNFIYVEGGSGDLGTLYGDAVTRYEAVFRANFAVRLTDFKVRTIAKETTANATVDILKAASGTAMTSGTAMVTQIDPDTFVDSTDEALVVKSDGSEDLAAGDTMYLKVVSGAATSALKHLSYWAKLRRLI
jgi:hypothetical protein